jgi:hypothetical protein
MQNCEEHIENCIQTPLANSLISPKEETLQLSQHLQNTEALNSECSQGYTELDAFTHTWDVSTLGFLTCKNGENYYSKVLFYQLMLNH